MGGELRFHLEFQPAPLVFIDYPNRHRTTLIKALYEAGFVSFCICGEAREEQVPSLLRCQLL